MKHSLVLYPDPDLNIVSSPVTEFNQELKDLTDEMFLIMNQYNGLGLAAIQVREKLRLMTMNYNGIKAIICNPTVLRHSGSKNFKEGCLSIPGVVSDICRPTKIVVKYQSINGQEKENTFTDVHAQCILHEIDHMDGKLFIDRIPSHKMFFFKNTLQHLKNDYEKKKG